MRKAREAEKLVDTLPWSVALAVNAEKPTPVTAIDAIERTSTSIQRFAIVSHDPSGRRVDQFPFEKT